MCSTYSGNELKRPVVPDDLPLIIGAYGDRHGGLIRAMFRPVTRDLFVPVPVFVTLVDLVVRQLEDRMPPRFGTHIRFSALVPHSLDRYQSREMELVHDGMTTFNMAEANRRDLNEALEPYGLTIAMDCCCGARAVPRETLDEYLESEGYRTGNRLRTLADSYGSIDQVSSVDHIADKLLPQDEKDAYRRIIRISRDVVTKNKVLPSDLIKPHVPAALAAMVDRIVRVIPELTVV